MVSDKMSHLSVFQMVGFLDLDPIQNLDNLQPNFFLTIWNPD